MARVASRGARRSTAKTRSKRFRSMSRSPGKVNRRRCSRARRPRRTRRRLGRPWRRPRRRGPGWWGPRIRLTARLDDPADRSSRWCRGCSTVRRRSLVPRTPPGRRRRRARPRWRPRRPGWPPVTSATFPSQSTPRGLRDPRGAAAVLAPRRLGPPARWYGRSSGDARHRRAHPSSAAPGRPGRWPRSDPRAAGLAPGPGPPRSRARPGRDRRARRRPRPTNSGVDTRRAGLGSQRVGADRRLVTVVLVQSTKTRFRRSGLAMTTVDLVGVLAREHLPEPPGEGLRVVGGGRPHRHREVQTLRA